MLCHQRKTADCEFCCKSTGIQSHRNLGVQCDCRLLVILLVRIARVRSWVLRAAVATPGMTSLHAQHLRFVHSLPVKWLAYCSSLLTFLLGSTARTPWAALFWLGHGILGFPHEISALYDGISERFAQICGAEISVHMRRNGLLKLSGTRKTRIRFPHSRQLHFG